jgi:hypothetical protein
MWNLLFTWWKNQEPTHCKIGNKPHHASRGFSSIVKPTGSNSHRRLSTLYIISSGSTRSGCREESVWITHKTTLKFNSSDPQSFTCLQCSRLKPSYEFHFEGFSNFRPSIERLVQIQDINPRILKWTTKLILGPLYT